MGTFLGPLSETTLEGLDQRYEAYCQRQVLRLLKMMPREAVRPLYRRARQAEGAASPVSGVEDPMALLVRYCRGIFPLPTFDVWATDRARHPAEYLDDRGPWDEGRIHEPVAVEERTFSSGERSWVACLELRPDGDVWRGRISFRDPEGDARHRTADIFCETLARDAHDRFRGYDRATLQAFLRSALP